MYQVDEATVSAQIRDLFKEYYAVSTPVERTILATRIAGLHDLLNCLIAVGASSTPDETTH